MNKKDIVRNLEIRITVSEQEKNLFYTYAKELGLMPTRLARNILLQEAESSIIIRKYQKIVLGSYKKYAEITKDKEILNRFKENEEFYKDLENRNDNEKINVSMTKNEYLEYMKWKESNL